MFFKKKPERPERTVDDVKKLIESTYADLGMKGYELTDAEYQELFELEKASGAYGFGMWVPYCFWLLARIRKLEGERK